MCRGSRTVENYMDKEKKKITKPEEKVAKTRQENRIQVYNIYTEYINRT